MRILVYGFALVCISFTFGCAQEWVHGYKKPDELVYDYNKCEREAEARQNTGANAVTITPYVMQGMIDQCLKQNGWVKPVKRKD